MMSAWKYLKIGFYRTLALFVPKYYNLLIHDEFGEDRVSAADRTFPFRALLAHQKVVGEIKRLKVSAVGSTSWNFYPRPHQLKREE